MHLLIMNILRWEAYTQYYFGMVLQMKVSWDQHDGQDQQEPLQVPQVRLEGEARPRVPGVQRPEPPTQTETAAASDPPRTEIPQVVDRS